MHLDGDFLDALAVEVALPRLGLDTRPARLAIVTLADLGVCQFPSTTTTAVLGVETIAARGLALALHRQYPPREK